MMEAAIDCRWAFGSRRACSTASAGPRVNPMKQGGFDVLEAS